MDGTGELEAGGGVGAGGDGGGVGGEGAAGSDRGEWTGAFEGRVRGCCFVGGKGGQVADGRGEMSTVCCKVRLEDVPARISLAV